MKSRASIIAWIITALFGTLISVVNPQVVPKNLAKAELPFEIAFQGVVFLPITVNSSPPMKFLLDSAERVNDFETTGRSNLV